MPFCAAIDSLFRCDDHLATSLADRWQDLFEDPSFKTLGCGKSTPDDQTHDIRLCQDAGFLCATKGVEDGACWRDL